VNRLFKELTSDLETHLYNQEHEIFPYIKQMVYAQRDHEQILDQKVQLYIESMKAEYRYFNAKINRIVSLMGRVEISGWPETTASVLLRKLKEFKQDFYHHVHLEKNILFPKALKLEGKVRNVRG
jgi:regulator of cell morphogenesis and NO signaling